MWEFYLSYCEAGFKSKNIDLIQFSLQNKWVQKETYDNK
jgi:cyclopropane-fatty-acyl-phospholipid synthase